MGLFGLWCLLHLRKQLSTVQHFLRCNPHARPAGREWGANSRMWPRFCRYGVQGALPPFKMNAGSASRSVGSQAHVVPGKFEGWLLHVNATPYTALARWGG